MTPESPYPHVFRPITIGTMRLRNRVMVPPHGSAVGDLWGTEREAARHIAYWEARAKDGASWIDGVRGRVRNPVVPGFEPSGYGAGTLGNYREPNYVERVRELVTVLHRAGAAVTSQLTVIGGVPQAPSTRTSSPMQAARPHVMRRDEIAGYVEEYRYSAARARDAGLDGIELHLNHDDMLEWFLSPLTNDRDDEYGGSLENRARFAVEALSAVREEIGSGTTLGVRFTMREEAPGGYTAEDGLVIAQYLESTGLIDFLHAVIGSPWGDPSYIQPQYYRSAEWAGLAGALRAAVSLPVVYTGRVTSVAVAEEVLASGGADVVGMARAYIAEPRLLTKALDGREDEVRPCVGGNDCISRQYAERLPFGCAVNPHASHEVDGPWPKAARPRALLVVGGGPAGMELAGLAAESGHAVELWEAADELGGQLRTATKAPSFDRYADYLRWQVRRLDRAGVRVRLGHRATADEVAGHGADVVAVATGAVPHRPPIDGVDGPHVLDIRDVLDGAATGKRVLVIARDDHLPPLGLADHLSERGREVTLVYAVAQAGALLGRYILGGILARLHKRGVAFRQLEEVVAIHPDGVRVRNVYSGATEDLHGFDTIVLACGGDSDASLYGELRERLPEVHLLGDAYAPRRLVAATRQAYALAGLLAE
ncbi:oxidoreductase [Actinomadura algeriensis]|uniref:2,4-dienoyl-CoA reductase-like NADH-dependent reductase (Old Yellow Enzyme family)/thioredoxin reductase n=1 Tax=Actinomadura algeriensis TaxID=1679523 RepID=A0ABR9K293_9ACTN|nr:FAD-dependent oxidoreductase [Actinomadura algeriensis]MBE1536979.1 2,4-dienoyl-CoA reductase-like NADH-dependent reductase (Old Yellow Enzyme family)/thioredoxin reductase [Actinomadura algeriensis]